MAVDQINAKRIYVIDGNDFSTLIEFYEVISHVLISGAFWGRNLDAFNDIMRGGFGTPEGGFVLRWKNSGQSRVKLGYPETVRVLEERLIRCHPANREAVAKSLAEARRGHGETIFETLVSIIEDHGLGGSEQEDGVELILE